MGWTYCDVWSTKQMMLAELRKELSGGAFTVVTDKSTTQGWYIVVANRKTGNRELLTFLCERRTATHVHGYAWGYKDMTESMGPYGLTDCPLKFFDMVPCPDNDSARGYRDRVRHHHAEKVTRRGKTRHYIIGRQQGDVVVAVALCKPSGNSKRKFSNAELAKLAWVSGKLVNLGEHWK